MFVAFMFGREYFSASNSKGTYVFLIVMQHLAQVLSGYICTIQDFIVCAFPVKVLIDSVHTAH